jgi:hypothetical protein
LLFNRTTIFRIFRDYEENVGLGDNLDSWDLSLASLSARRGIEGEAKLWNIERARSIKNEEGFAMVY